MNYSLLFILSSLFLSACFKPIVRGYHFSPDMDTELQIVVGMSREEIIETLSEPTFEISNTMYYVSSVNKQHPILPERELYKKSLVIKLDNNEIATKVDIKEIGKKEIYTKLKRY